MSTIISASTTDTSYIRNRKEYFGLGKSKNTRSSLYVYQCEGNPGLVPASLSKITLALERLVSGPDDKNV